MKKDVYTDGFTLVEFLVNILIVTGISFSIFFLFSNIQNNVNNENNLSEILNYGNRILDELESEITLASKINTVFATNDYTILNLSYPNNNTVNNYFLSYKNGLLKNNVPFDNYINEDSQNRKKFEIKKFKITNNPNNILGSNSDNKTFNSLRLSTYLITLEIDIFNRYQNVIKTIKYEREFYSPSKYIDIRTNNQEYDI